MHFSHLRIAQLGNHFYKNSFVLFGRFVTMPYKISFTNITNLNYVGKSFHGEFFVGEGYFPWRGAGFSRYY